jgi:hypothetical protein
MGIQEFRKPPGHPLKQVILDMMWLKYRRTPRHVQTDLGPSEIGETCTRKLAQNAFHQRKINEGDPLPSIIGTAAHKWMDEACTEWNEHLGRIRFIPEPKVWVTDGIYGHTDCYDLDTGSVIDWKFPGVAILKGYKENGPSHLYRAQAHLYGLAWRRLGLPVNEVVIVFFPRGGLLSGMHIWSEPFNPDIAEKALERYYRVVELGVALDVEHHPERFKFFEAVPGQYCQFCPWWKPGPDTGTGCPGNTQ